MNINFLIVQVIGFVAWILLMISYYQEDTNRILFFQIIATIFYCVHYYLLSAYSGLFICIFEVFRDYLYYCTEIDRYIFYFSIPVYLVFGIVSFTGWFDLFPIVSGLLDGYTLTKSKNTVIIGAIISYIFWFIYDICVMSISCAITDGFVVLSNFSILLFDFNPFDYKKKEKNPLILKR